MVGAGILHSPFFQLPDPSPSILLHQPILETMEALEVPMAELEPPMVLELVVLPRKRKLVSSRHLTKVTCPV